MGLFTSKEKKEKITHLKILIGLAFADGHIDVSEIAAIAAVCKREGIKESEFKRTLKNPKKGDFIISQDFDTQIKYLRDMVLLMMIDGDIHDNEKKLCKKVADKMGFKTQIIDDMIKDISEDHPKFKQNKAWSGSGFAIGKGYIVTNHHVVDGAKSIKIQSGTIEYPVKLVAFDKNNDIAILRRNDADFQAPPYSLDFRTAKIGEKIFVLGYPLTQALGDDIKLSEGSISSMTGYQGNTSTYQMSAPIHPGNSGGPMFDNEGNVIGIVVAGVKGAQNVGYAIKTAYLKVLIESADLYIPKNKNIISSLSLPEKVQSIQQHVYYIKCSQ